MLPTATDAVVPPTRTDVENAISPKVSAASTPKTTSGLSGCSGDSCRAPATDGLEIDDSSVGPPDVGCELSPYTEAAVGGVQSVPSTAYAPDPAANTVSVTYSRRGDASATPLWMPRASRSSAAVPMSRTSLKVFSWAKSWQPKPHTPTTSTL